MTESLTELARRHMRDLLHTAETMPLADLNKAASVLAKFLDDQANLSADLENQVCVLERGLADLRSLVSRRFPYFPVNAGDNVVYPERFQSRGVDMSRARAPR